MSTITDHEFTPADDRMLFSTPEQGQTLLSAPVRRFDGPVDEAPTAGLVVIVDHGQHACQIDTSVYSLRHGTLIVARVNGVTLAHTFIGDREYWDQTKTNRLGYPGVAVSGGPDETEVEREAERFLSNLRQWAVTVTLHSAEIELEKVTTAIQKYDSGVWDTYDLKLFVSTPEAPVDEQQSYREAELEQNHFRSLVEYCASGIAMLTSSGT